MIRPFAAVLAAVLLSAPALAMAPVADDAPAVAADADYAKAEELIDEGRYAEAVPILKALVARSPDNADD